MRIFIILIFIFGCSFGQTTRLIYTYEFISDSNNPKNISKEYMFLDIHQKDSEFYGYKNYHVDSTFLEHFKKGLSFMPPNLEYINFRINKNFQNHQINMITKIGSIIYGVLDDHELQWKITNQKANILGYSVTSAEINFGGRNWIAWFALEIPIQDGPYKFNGLPGLILKIEDEHRNHSFIAKEIIKLKNHTNYPLTENSKPHKHISQQEFRKLLIDYRKDPLKNLQGRYPDQTDSEGNFRTGDQVFRDEEKLFKERIRKDNNFLEIDLLRE